MPRKKKEEDYVPVVMADLAKLRSDLKDAEEVLTICEGCGVDCNGMLPKISNLHKLVDKFEKIFKRTERESK